MKTSPAFEIVNVIQYVFATLQDNPVFQIIQIAASVLTSIVLIGYRLWKWYKEAKADGKIDAEEIDEAVNIAVDGAEEIKDKLDEKGKDDGKNG